MLPFSSRFILLRSDSPSASLSLESLSEELELELELSDELSEAWPVSVFKSTLSAIAAKSGS